MKKNFCTIFLLGLFFVITSSAHAATYYFSGEVESSDYPPIDIGTQFDGLFSYDANAVATHTEFVEGKMGTGQNMWSEYEGALDIFEVAYYTMDGLRAYSLTSPGTITVGKLFSLFTIQDLVTVPEVHPQVFRMTGMFDDADFTIELINLVYFGVPPDLKLPTTLSLSDFDYCRLALTYEDISGINYTANGTINELKAVPIPPAVWLFGCGLIGLACFKSKFTLKQ